MVDTLCLDLLYCYSFLSSAIEDSSGPSYSSQYSVHLHCVDPKFYFFCDLKLCAKKFITIGQPILG